MNDKALTTIKEKRELSLSQKVAIETRNREIMTEFITKHMKDGTDYGSIMIGGRNSKPSLFKPGAEKIASLLKLRADVIRDNETWEMSGSKPGLFCYRCNLYALSTNELVGMGLGACSLEEKKSYNNAIKIAKKRAFVDAILSTGALSDFFTQDLEDIAHEERQPQKSLYQQAKEHPEAYKQPEEAQGNPFMITEKQVKFIHSLLSQKGYTEKQLEDKYDVTKIEELTSEQASTIIGNLMKLKDKPKESEKKEEINIDEIPDFQGRALN